MDGRRTTTGDAEVFFFEMLSWEGLGGRSPPQESLLPVPCPPGGSGGLRPPGISVNYPCLASAAAVPCPRALPPIFFRPNFFVRIFLSEFSSYVRPSSVRPSSVRRPSVVRPSARPSSARPSVRPSVRQCFVNLVLHGGVLGGAVRLRYR